MLRHTVSGVPRASRSATVQNGNVKMGLEQQQSQKKSSPAAKSNHQRAVITSVHMRSTAHREGTRPPAAGPRRINSHLQ